LFLVYHIGYSISVSEISNHFILFPRPPINNDEIHFAFDALLSFEQSQFNFSESKSIPFYKFLCPFVHDETNTLLYLRYACYLVALCPSSALTTSNHHRAWTLQLLEHWDGFSFVCVGIVQSSICFNLR